jgi:TPR repeat protein
MAEVFVAATAGEEPKALGLAEALKTLGFDAAAGTPQETEIAAIVDNSKCVLALWSRAAPGATWLTALGVLALERKKLVSAEIEGGVAPAPLKSAPRVDLAARDRTKFKAAFQALVVEIDKLSPTRGNTEALPDALAKARAAVLKPPLIPGESPLRTVGKFAAVGAAVFAIGFGAGRVINAVRTGEFLVATAPADAAPTSAPAPAPAKVEPPPRRQPVRAAVSDADLQDWRGVADRIDAAMAERIRAGVTRGEARALTLACLAHMTGAGGFLPSPSAARGQCDAAAEQHYAPGLYLSWVLHRTAPHAGLDAATARARLAEAARLGWTPAQIDYALALAPNTRAPLDAQAEAGRLLLAAAERGDARGQYHYAKWLRDSAAGPRDPAAAIPFLTRAAERNQPDALHMLATLHRDGIGATRDPARARALYEQAARLNHAPSMFNLADMLRNGPEADRARAVELYRALACMRDERQIQPLAVQRLRALRESASCR